MIKENIITKNKKINNNGCNCYVYELDKYIVKFPRSENEKKMFNLEVDFYKQFKSDFIPKYISDGNVYGYRYLIIEKINRKTLYDCFSSMNVYERQEAIEKVSLILKRISEFDAEFYAVKNGLHTDNFGLCFVDVLRKHLIPYFIKHVIDCKRLEYLADNFIEIIFKNIEHTLCYNDLHFRNFIVDGSNVFAIDFDRFFLMSNRLYY